MTDPPTDVPDRPPWAEALDLLAAALDDLAIQLPRALSAGVTPEDLLAELDPWLERLVQLRVRVHKLVEQARYRSVWNDVAREALLR